MKGKVEIEGIKQYRQTLQELGAVCSHQVIPSETRPTRTALIRTEKKKAPCEILF